MCIGVRIKTFTCNCVSVRIKRLPVTEVIRLVQLLGD